MLEGKTVVVSGTGPGLGREIAAAAVRDGANVVLGARTEANLEKAAQEIDPSGERVAWRVTDLRVDWHEFYIHSIRRPWYIRRSAPPTSYFR